MKKKYFFAAMALVALASCSSDDFVGENNNSPNLNPAPASGEKAIVFNSGANAITRADHVGSDAAGMLNNTFVFAGTKSTYNGTTTPAASIYVFDQYTANFVENTANTTESNSHNWEYVGQTLAPTTSLPAGSSQTIKYWDYATTQYDFAAYSFGNGYDPDSNPATDNTTFAQAKTAGDVNSPIAVGDKSYTLKGSANELKACYISDLVTAYNRNDVNDYGKVVEFRFRSLATKIRLAFYETIPGYSVKDVKFYTTEDGDLANDGTEEEPTLFVKTTSSFKGLPSGEGTMTVSFPLTGWTNRNETNYNKAHVSFLPKDEGDDLSSTMKFDELDGFAGAESQEADDGYLGRSSNLATYAGGLSSSAPREGKYYTILPYEAGANLLLRIKYTLVSTDGSGETMTVDNATAVIPAELAKWNPNYAYTYIFKISDMTNGSTGQDGSGNIITGLTPITLNAVVVDSEDGIQETITTVATPSITTYTKGEVVTTQSEYSKNANIYIIVNSGTSNVTLTPGTNAWLYTATLESGAAQTLNEASVDNALHYGTYNSTAKTYTVHDANAKNLVLTDVTAKKQDTETTADLFQSITEIAAADSPTGNLITVAGAKFYPEAAGKYVFAYRVSDGSADATTAAYNANATYYSMTPTNSGFYLEATPTAAQISDWATAKSNFTTNPTQPVYAYKIIIVL